MDVRWRERDWSQLRDAVANARPAVRASLAASGLLKFFECPLIRAQEYLLQFLLEMWSPDHTASSCEESRSPSLRWRTSTS
jgi:hypothetical protein